MSEPSKKMRDHFARTHAASVGGPRSEQQQREEAERAKVETEEAASREALVAAGRAGRIQVEALEPLFARDELGEVRRRERGERFYMDPHDFRERKARGLVRATEV